VRQGVTGVAAHVAEPYLDATIRPNVLFPAYMSGMNLAESFYLAMPYLSWQSVVIGDPLCAPFPRKALQSSEIDKGIDPETELPALFSARRLKVFEGLGAKPEAARASLRADARAAKGDTAGMRRALEEAVDADPRLRAAQLLLAAEYERSKEHDRAMERYRALLSIDPKDPIALNNLAYALAVHKGQLNEALGHAERAYALAPNSPSVADTLGWIQHLQGRHQEAARLLALAVRLAPGNGEIRLHSAVVQAATGALDAAKKELEEAVRLDPELANREEAKALLARVK
jgi:tetratricopeptide (TPR) repeat protein